VWQDLPVSPAQRRRRQWLGAAAVSALLALGVGVRFWASGDEGHARLAEAFEHLEAARSAPAANRSIALRHAEAVFRRGIGALRVEPLALIGLSLIDPMHSQLGLSPPQPPALTSLSDGEPLAYTHGLLRRGHPDLALAWLDRLRQARQPHESLQQLQLFAEMWRTARLRAEGH